MVCLLACNRLAAARCATLNGMPAVVAFAESETAAVDDLSAKDKIKELVLFSVSEEYFRLRETLGIVIGT